MRQGNETYLHDLTERGYDLQAVVRHLDWNMLNQVYVFGCFHADLHPANLFVLPGNAVGYVDFGIIGQLPEAVRVSLTRYNPGSSSRATSRRAIRELMRWLAPTAATDAASARQQLVRVHQAFIYGLGGAAPAPPGRRRAGEPGGREPLLQAGGGRDANGPALRPDSGPQRGGLLEDAGHPRRPAPPAGPGLRCPPSWALLRAPAAAAGASWLDPRTVMGRAYEGSIRLRRALEFVELLETQAPLITAVGESYFGARKLQALRRRVLALRAPPGGRGRPVRRAGEPGRHPRRRPRPGPTPGCTWGLLALLVLLILSLALQGRRLGRAE